MSEIEMSIPLGKYTLDPMFTAGSKRFQTIACWLIPLIFGCWSLALGQDSNWDQSNYHFYNGFAFLDGKLGIDFAPAGIQSYFNPLLDVVSYLLYTHLPAPLVGFLLGTWHGMAFCALLSITRRVLGSTDAERPGPACFWLAAAGCLTANFLSGLGNSMGDDTTAVIVLFGVSTCMIALPDTATAAKITRTIPDPFLLLAGGTLIGLACGLKLTNAVYAVALVAALLIGKGSLALRVKMAVLGGIGILIGVSVTGGFWFAQMWDTFRNPVFPMFSHLFPNPLIGSMPVGDSAVWLPKSALETLLWPFIFTHDALRVGQARIRQIIWPILYLLFFAWLTLVVIRAARRRPLTKITARAAFIIVFVAVGYVVWMKIFSLYRYVVPMETLAPLAVYVLLWDCLSAKQARWFGILILSVATLIVLLGGAKSWGHQKWAKQAFTVDVPHVDSPARDLVVIVGSAPPYGWLIPFFPKELAFTQIDGNFPRSAGFFNALESQIGQRNGNLYAILSIGENAFGNSVQVMNEARLSAQNSARAPLREAHLRLIAGTCAPFMAKIGQGPVPYQWCRVERVTDAAASTEMDKLGEGSAH